MKQKIQEACENICQNKLTTTEPLFASGHLDSFRFMELICCLEETFGIMFEPDEIEQLDNFSNIESITELVGSKIKK